MKKSSFINNLFNILKYNFNTLFKFELLYKIFITSLILPFLVYCFNKSVNLSGINYLTLFNLEDYIVSGYPFILMLITVLLLTIFSLFEISSLIIIFDASYHRLKIGLFETIKIAFVKTLKMFKPKNLLIIFFVIFLVPFLNIGIGSSVLSIIKMPTFISDYLLSDKKLLIAYAVILFGLFFALMKTIYSMHFMVLEDVDYREACNLSNNLSYKHFMGDLFRYILSQIIITGIYLLVILFIIVLNVLIIKLLNKYLVIKSILISILWILIGLTIIVASTISNATSYGIISSLYYKHRRDKGDYLRVMDYSGKCNKNKILRIIYILFIGILITILSIFIYNVFANKIKFNIDLDIKTTVTAHRGASDRYPENTMSAFKGAKELGADWIELDVLQTKDQQLVIAHDNSLKRITGDKKVKITNSTYEELLKYDFGLYKGEEFRDEKIPLLSQALEYARDNNIKLNIELKPKGQEVNFEQSILDMIYQYDMQDRCVVTSINYKAVKKLRELDKNIKVVYVMPIAIGDFYKDDTVDAFSIEVSFVNEKVIEEIHKRGKEIYVWTIDDEETMNNMIALGVDSIITNNIELANKLIDEKKHTNLLEEFVKKMLELS